MGLHQNPPGRVRGRRFEKGRSGNPLGWRNKTTIAAASLLAWRGRGLTRRAVELALTRGPSVHGRDPWARCGSASNTSCRDRSVKFALPPIESAADIPAAMKAVTHGAGGCNPITNLAPSFLISVISAKAGTQDFSRLPPCSSQGQPLGPRFRGDDGLSCLQDFLTASLAGGVIRRARWRRSRRSYRCLIST
jgi:hypothetical protein